MQTKYKWFSIVFVFFLVLDQVSKIWVVNNIEYRTEEIEVISGLFSLVHTQNSGAAFGIMQGQMLIFAVFTLIAIFVLGQMIHQLPAEDRFQSFGVGLLLSGVLGNGIDRMHKQSVTDFLHFYSDHPSVEPLLVSILGSNAWPSFNVADAAIVIGMIMFGFHYLFLEKDEDAEPEPTDTTLADELLGVADTEDSPIASVEEPQQQ